MIFNIRILVIVSTGMIFGWQVKTNKRKELSDSPEPKAVKLLLVGQAVRGKGLRAYTTYNGTKLNSISSAQ